jgi:hypothetical protein
MGSIPDTAGPERSPSVIRPAAVVPTRRSTITIDTLAARAEQPHRATKRRC